ncbi:ribonuclease Z [Paenibacillus pini JCM 16418]|uniref:Ribonuclease Z n=1 Tax=Paenibacillus pini JCM 16418 TaxID=1236976 RepID=W7YS93_9BACL|nr:ribonuclease Z [Paenibacillus pini JCM 16418]
MHDLQITAHNYYHSTALQAAEAAQLANAKELVLTHFSSRYKDMEQLQPLLVEAKNVFQNTLLAEEFSSIPVKRN